MFREFLSVPDSRRALQTLQKLARHNVQPWALTGGLAIEIHLMRLGCRPTVRFLNDLDFVTASFSCIPETLAADFLFRHIHPFDPPGKTMLQLVDPDSSLRIDVFGADGATMDRTLQQDLTGAALRVVSLEDLAARTARLALDLAESIPGPSKHARDFLRLAELVDPAAAETAWRDHRKPKHPTTFAETNRLLQHLIPAYPELLIEPAYSKDTAEVCPRCKPTAAFALADPKAILSLLGYC